MVEQNAGYQRRTIIQVTDSYLDLPDMPDAPSSR